MYGGKTFLALIPARSGSKGVKDKNIRLLHGKPLIAYSIEAAIESGVMDAVVVSTDSERYADIAREYGAEVPFLRPQTLAADKTLASEYIVYTLECLLAAGRVYDYFVLLQPTSPLRTKAHIRDCVHMAVDEGLCGVVTFSETECPMEYCHRLPEDMRLDSLNINDANRNDFAPFYRETGFLFICACDEFLKTRNFYGSNSKALLIDRRWALDIDSEYDFELAEFLMERRQGETP